MKLLDLFCGAGGAATGYHQAGFDEIVGVDIKPQKHYPFTFVQGDALEYLREHGSEFDFIHASPPCQAYSAGSRMRNGYAKEHPKLVEPVRDLLVNTGRPSAIENVEDAPLINAIRLCGSSFGLLVRRHRKFECSFMVTPPACHHKLQSVVIGVYGDHPENALIRKGHPARRAKDMAEASEAMGIDWMPEWKEIKEAIPPAYTKFIGEAFLATLEE